jgi:hypothetical protein
MTMHAATTARAGGIRGKCKGNMKHLLKMKLERAGEIARSGWPPFARALSSGGAIVADAGAVLRRLRNSAINEGFVRYADQCAQTHLRHPPILRRSSVAGQHKK